jgi:hypothetical protein
MHLYFDIQHRGDFFLDDEGKEFGSIGAACDHLAQAQVLRSSVRVAMSATSAT